MTGMSVYVNGAGKKDMLNMNSMTGVTTTNASDAEYLADFRTIWTAAHANCAEPQAINGLNIPMMSLTVLHGTVAKSMLQEYITFVADAVQQK